MSLSMDYCLKPDLHLLWLGRHTEEECPDSITQKDAEKALSKRFIGACDRGGNRTSKLGYLTLFICTLHTYLYGWDKFLHLSSYKWCMPPAYMFSLVVPSALLLLKLLLLLPCVDKSLTRIRLGWERTDPEDVTRKLLLT